MEDKHDTVNNFVFYEFSSEARKYLFDPNQNSNLSLLYNIDVSSGLVGLKLLVIFEIFESIFLESPTQINHFGHLNLMSNTPRHFLSTCQLMWFTPPTYKESSYLQRTAMSTKIQMRSKKMSHDSIQRIFKVRFVSSNPWERNNSCWWWLFAVYCISSVWHPLFTNPLFTVYLKCHITYFVPRPHLVREDNQYSENHKKEFLLCHKKE